MSKAARRIKRIGSFLLAVTMIAGIFLDGRFVLKAQAAGGKKLTLNAAKAMAVEESTAYFAIENDIETKKANLESSRKKIKLKQQSMSTFRWTPLLSFKFPTKPNEAQAFEFQFKLIQIQSEIDTAKHKLTDTKLAIYEDINNLYVDIVFLQRKIAFEETRIQSYTEGLARNKARLLTGDATQADVDAISKKLEKARSDMATDQRTLNADLEKLSTKIGMNVTTGYTFEVPFLEASIPRSYLEELTQYTLDRDQAYYEACMAETTERISLEINHNLMRNKFGSDIDGVSSYVRQALSGVEIKGSILKGFKNDYDQALKNVDRYWEGKKRILFIKIPRLWFKGDIDGVRYVDDDPKVLYENVLSYSSSRVEKTAAEEDLIQTVKDTFENYISIRNSYLAAIKELDKAEADLEADYLRNQIGEVSFEEYSSELADFEDLQNSFLTSMKTYSETLYSFDRLTCGGVSKYFEDNDASLSAGKTGNSTVEKEVEYGARYFIKSIIQQEAFEVSIYIPDDFSVEITDFELWCDGEQVGSRTPKEKTIRHLALSKNVVKEAKIRLYNGSEFVDDVVIDPSNTEGALPIVAGRNIVKAESDEIGTYSSVVNEITGIVTVTIEITEDEAVAYYRVETESGSVLSGKDPIKNGEGFKHLAIIEDGLDDAVIVLLDKTKEELYRARFSSATRKIKKKE